MQPKTGKGKGVKNRDQGQEEQKGESIDVWKDVELSPATFSSLTLAREPLSRDGRKQS